MNACSFQAWRANFVLARSITALFLALLGPGLPGLIAATPSSSGPESHQLISFDEDILDYRHLQAAGPVAQLQQRLTHGSVKLGYETSHGYLLSVLQALKIPPSSQVLVFTKTSLQRDHISPRTPRAIYFNDEVYVAWAPEAPLLEVSAVEPAMGGVWYTLEQAPQDSPRFERNNRCLECHVTSKTLGVPGHLFRSNIPDEQGRIDLLDSTSMVDHRTPLAARWGGWYVTGTHGRQTHRGNVFIHGDIRTIPPDLSTNGNITDLGGFFDTVAYPEPGSDIVALLVLGHQLHMHNLITLLNYESNVHLARYGHIRYLRELAEDFLKYMLFVEEAPLDSPIHGTSSFAADFAALGPKDAQGRSLRQFDLQSRLFKYPCSYLIYSPAFDNLPQQMKRHLFQRLHTILTNQDDSPDYRKISPGTRQAIRQILIQTKPDLPLNWTL